MSEGDGWKQRQQEDTFTRKTQANGRNRQTGALLAWNCAFCRFTAVVQPIRYPERSDKGNDHEHIKLLTGRHVCMKHK